MPGLIRNSNILKSQGWVAGKGGIKRGQSAHSKGFATSRPGRDVAKRLERPAPPQRRFFNDVETFLNSAALIHFPRVVRQLRPFVLWCVMPDLERGPGTLAVGCMVACMSKVDICF
jgi:hypothetical protein